jgi:hypothetical protein
MRFLDYLNEEYQTYLDIKDKHVPIFKNPTKSDFAEILKNTMYGRDNCSVRYIIDLKNKDIYIWEAHWGIHIIGLAALKKSGVDVNNKDVYNFYFGEGEISNNKIDGDRGLPYRTYVHFYKQDSIAKELKLGDKVPKEDTFDNKDLRWLDKYFVKPPKWNGLQISF